jgi:hemerythrin-like domain-containing protein
MATSFVDVLIEEHRGFKLMLSVLEAMALRLEQRREVAPRMVADVLDFFEKFSDRHHAREERALFPVLALHGMNRDQTVVHALLVQHDAGRVYYGKLRSDQARMLAGEPAAADGFVSHALAYCELIREHIRIEDEYFYALADQLLTEAEQQDVVAEFSTPAPGSAAAAEKERFMRMLDEYPGLVAAWT